MQDSMLPECYRLLNDEIRSKLAKKQADFTVFALDRWCTCAPFAPPWICWCTEKTKLCTLALVTFKAITDFSF